MEKKGLISSRLWGYYMFCIDPAEQTAAVGLHGKTQPRTPQFLDLLLLHNKPSYRSLHVKYVVDQSVQIEVFVKRCTLR